MSLSGKYFAIWCQLFGIMESSGKENIASMAEKIKNNTKYNTI